MNKTRIPGLAAVLLLSAVAIPLRAQSEAASTTTTKEEEPVVLEKINVNDVPIEQQILPTSRPFNSVFGTDDNIVDVPRNVTIISRQQLSDISISSVLDFSKLTSSAYTTTNFGAPSNPSIRGQTADLFINGVRGRITSNGNGLPMDFNSVESVNIVKGPATAVQGTSMYVGGYIDLQTKRPYFDAHKGSISATVGSYGYKAWTLDDGGPLSKTAAYRFSYSGIDANGYWHDYYNKNHSIYGALTFRPSNSYEVFFNATAAFYRYTENWGINRVTQDLIDHGTYQTGVNNNPAPASGYPPYFDASGLPLGFGVGAGGSDVIGVVGGTPAVQSDPQNSKWVTSGYPYVNRIAWGPTVTINRHERLLKPGDHSTGREFNAQAIQSLTVSPDLKIENNTFWSYTARNTLSSYYYSEIVDPSWFAENRTSFILKKSFVSINTGLDLRYQRTKAYDDYFFEPANVWDLTKDHNYINVYNSVNFPNPFTSLPIPGWSGRYATDGLSNGDTNDSHGTTVGPFFQSTWKLGDKFSVIAGGREDYFKAHVREPLLSNHPEGDIDVWIPSLNGSVNFKPTPDSTVYFTYNYSQNTSGAVGNGGGITGWNTSGATPFLDKELFTQPSELYEVGSKFALMQNKVFLNFALYDQTRTAKSTSSTVLQKFRARGFETELNYQPNKHLYATLSYSYINATVTAPFQSDGGIALLPTEAIDYGLHRVSGLPLNQINGLVSYTFDNGFGFSLDANWTSKINNNYAGTLVIPSQYVIDAGIFYRMKHWEYRLSVSNVTDEKNWSPPNAVYGNASILPDPGTQGQFTVKYSF